MVEDVAIFDQKMFKLCTKAKIYSFKGISSPFVVCCNPINLILVFKKLNMSNQVHPYLYRCVILCCCCDTRLLARLVVRIITQPL